METPPKGPRPASRHPQSVVGERLLHIGAGSLRLRFLLGTPQTADKDDLLLFQSDGDAKFYDSHGRRPIQELVPTQSFYHANRDGREFN